MKFIHPVGETCTFNVHSDEAQQVKLVIEFDHGGTQIYALEEVEPNWWQAVLRLPPGEYRFCYHLYDGRTLTYLTPPGYEVDGLKGVLCVGSGEMEGVSPIHGDSSRRRGGSATSDHRSQRIAAALENGRDALLTYKPDG